VWTRCMLDNYATVADAVTVLRAEQFYVIPVASPDGAEGTLHLAISNATGDCAIFEYIGGKLVIHHRREYQVMTNTPVYDQQLALNAYWRKIAGTLMLPGTNRAADRFVRASFYFDAIPKTANNTEALASAFSVIRHAPVPLVISTPGEPNISSTIWRTVSDPKNTRYYYESTRSSSVFWMNLADMDFAAGKADDQTYADRRSDLRRQIRGAIPACRGLRVSSGGCEVGSDRCADRAMPPTACVAAWRCSGRWARPIRSSSIT
jgi:penicillin V acylase-like amidase (Ntn superfamily)